MKYKIKELFTQAQLSESPMLSDLSSEVWQSIYPYVPDDEGEPTSYNFMQEYLKDNLFQRMDSRFASLYGEKEYMREADNIINCLASFKLDMTNEIITRLPELSRLYYALQLNYNPLYNKDVRDTETLTGDDKHKHLGTLTDTSESGETKTEVEHEGLTDSGKPTGNVGVTDHKQTETQYAVPTNDQIEYEERKSVTDSEPMRTAEIGKDTETITHGKGIKTETDYTETITHGTTREIHSRGNQGVTKSTELLEDEFRVRMSISFWDTLYRLVTKDYTMYR